MTSESTPLQELRAAIQQQRASWQAAPNDLFLASDEEKRAHLGFNPPGGLEELQAREQQAKANLAAYGAQALAFGAPASFDWRNYGGRNFITPVKDQGSCGSCVAFGTTAAVEGTLRARIGDPTYPIDLSEAMLFYCIARDQGRNCGNGWWVPPALDGYKNTGVCDEACYPYTAGDQACTGRCADWAGRVVKIGNWHAISSIADMKTWLAGSGPLAACFTVYNDFFAYSSGVYRHVSGGVAGGHCVCCVGYDDAQSCWIMKNSWGAAWGDSGYFRIAYGECGIDATMWAVDSIGTGVWQNGKNIIGLWTIDQDRNGWVCVNGIGWKKIAADNDVIFYNLLAQLIAAKAANRPVNFYEEQGVIKQVYVW